MFDVNEDSNPQVKDIIGKFAETKMNTDESGKYASDELFSGMFKGGNFTNTKKNRDYIRANFGEELKEYANENIENSQTEENKQQEMKPLQAPKNMEYATNEGMSKWVQRLTRALEIAQEEISKNDDRRKVQAMAHGILANELGIDYKPALTKKLEEGQEKAIRAAHDILEKNGVFKLNENDIANYAYDYLKDNMQRKAEDDKINQWVEEQSQAEQDLVDTLSKIRDKKQAKAKIGLTV